MRYWHVCLSTNYCGTDCDYIVATSDELDEDDVLTGDFIDYYYAYSEGVAGITIGTEEEVENGEADETEEEYSDGIWCNSFCEEISKAEYDELLELGYSEIEI